MTINPPLARLFTEPVPPEPGRYVVHVEDGPRGSYLTAITPQGWFWMPELDAAARFTLAQASDLVRRCPVKAYMINLEAIR